MLLDIQHIERDRETKHKSKITLLNYLQPQQYYMRTRPGHNTGLT